LAYSHWLILCQNRDARLTRPRRAQAVGGVWLAAPFKRGAQPLQFHRTGFIAPGQYPVGQLDVDGVESCLASNKCSLKWNDKSVAHRDYAFESISLLLSIRRRYHACS